MGSQQYMLKAYFKCPAGSRNRKSTLCCLIQSQPPTQHAHVDKNHIESQSEPCTLDHALSISACTCCRMLHVKTLSSVYTASKYSMYACLSICIAKESSRSNGKKVYAWNQC